MSDSDDIQRSVYVHRRHIPSRPPFYVSVSVKAVNDCADGIAVLETKASAGKLR
jgi:hypothetical protein